MTIPRIWFTDDNTDGMTADDLTILNRAARIYLSGTTKVDLSRSDLSRLRLAFRKGISAQKIADALHYDDEAPP